MPRMDQDPENVQEAPEEIVEESPDSDGDSRTVYFRFKRSHVYATLMPLAFVAGIALGYLFWGRSQPVVQQAAAAPRQPSAPQRIEVEVDDDPFQGPTNAPITIVEFSDYNCPYCQRFHQNTFPALMEAYQGKIRFVYRDFPVVGGGATGKRAAVAANCAKEQGKFWEYHDALFSDRYSLDRDGLEGYAGEINLDMDTFVECLDSNRYDQEVENDLRYAANLGVSGTPTFFINGIPVVGAQPLSRFQEIIDSELQ